MKHILKSLDSTLGLIIRLRMKRRTKFELSSKSGLKGLPKTHGETTITVRNDVNGDTMMTNNFIRVDTS
ncbi:hypothetical protein HanRHA438_Chr17g0835461 [Helianthus annuus]|nr:hypothetical protein HanRHA438_Chr17g0835461 [Helianthus annuus]